MTLGALLDEIRDAYVTHLAKMVAAESPCYAEPALRSQDGTLALEGKLRLPYRVDIVRKADGSSVMVDTPRAIRFDPFRLRWADTLEMEFQGLAWDLTVVEIESLSSKVADWRPVRAWFLKWFDPEDERPLQPEGLYRVVHFLSDPELAGAYVRIQIDFGSAPVQAFEELLDALVTAGARNVSLKGEPDGAGLGVSRAPMLNSQRDLDHSKKWHSS